MQFCPPASSAHSNICFPSPTSTSELQMYNLEYCVNNTKIIFWINRTAVYRWPKKHAQQGI